jgi:hypothetical protein
VHRCGDEGGWWRKIGIDPITSARALWLQTHPLLNATAQPMSKLQNEANLESNGP